MATTRPVRKALMVSTMVLALSIIGALTASADQDDDPCPLSMVLLCRMLPISPQLDGDVDLTKPQSPANPDAPQQDSPPSPDSAAGGSSG
jgi:hypothetical protein